jgi:hypothetical protein
MVPQPIADRPGRPLLVELMREDHGAVAAQDRPRAGRRPPRRHRHHLDALDAAPGDFGDRAAPR